MCGIFCCLQRIKKDELKSMEIDGLTKQLLQNRGPNAQAELTIQTDHYNILFCGFVLWQQGSRICSQPHSHKNNTLLINGDIFTKREDYSISDTEWLMLQIDECNENEDALFDLFRRLEGPFSIIYYNRTVNKLYFCRDIFGRQSLLLTKTSNGDIILSSVLGSPSTDYYEKCVELHPLGVFCIDLLNDGPIQLNPWQPLNNENLKQLNELQESLSTAIDVRSSICSLWLIKPSEKNDSTYLYYNFESILKNSIKHSYIDIFEQLSRDKNVMLVCDEVIMRLEHSVIDRICATPPLCKECLITRVNICNHARIGILFSGGIDCTILAVLTDKHLETSHQIDLINVSFEKINRTGVNCQIDFNTPDRLSAKKSLKELEQINPKRKWNLVEVNVNRNELSVALKTRIHHLIFPLQTVLDESLGDFNIYFHGGVLWFGARGKGEYYSSNCRVLLIGSGADELFGGYTRHRNAFIRQYNDGLTQFERVEKELEFDFNRLPSRNLARDDRVAADFGISIRSPFIEEQFCAYVRSLKPYQKCFHALDQGVGDKLLLRLCGYRLGLKAVCSMKKKAMQFGSRISDPKQNAKDFFK